MLEAYGRLHGAVNNHERSQRPALEERGETRNVGAPITKNGLGLSARRSIEFLRFSFLGAFSGIINLPGPWRGFIFVY
jgi:hypothetical protein